MADSTDDLMATLRAAALDQPTVRGELRVDHLGPEGRIAGKVYAFAASHGRLRLEAVSPLDTPIRTVAVDGEHFSLIDQESHRCLLGEANPCLIGESVGLELSAAHVAAALIGAIPLIRHREVDSDWNDCGYYEVELVGEEQGWVEHIRLELHDGHLVPTQATVSGPEGDVLVLELSGHEPAGENGALMVPRRLSLRMPLSEADLRLEWRDIEVGVTLPERAWQVACPEGFSPEIPTCQSRASLPDFEPPGGERALPLPPPPDAGVPGSTDDSDGGSPSEDSDLSEELGL